jgi:hypothetical protein
VKAEADVVVGVHAGSVSREGVRRETSRNSPSKRSKIVKWFVCHGYHRGTLRRRPTWIEFAN